MPFLFAFIICIFAVLTPATLPAFAAGGEATLRWRANTEPDLAGYRLYYSTVPGSHAYSLNAGLTPSPRSPEHRISNLAGGTTYYFSITAYDRFGNESAHSLEVSKHIPGEIKPAEEYNRPPTPVTGPSQIVVAGDPVVLDGSGSYDEDRDALEYLWIQAAGNPVLLNPEDSARPEFRTEDAGDYSFQLVVSDGITSSTAEPVNVYVVDGILARSVVTPESGAFLEVSEGPAAGMRLDVPPGAVDEETVVAIAREASVSPPEGKILLGEPVVLEPEGLEVGQSVGVALPYDPILVPDSDRIEGYRFDSSTGEWAPAPFSEVDVENGLAWIHLDRLGPVALVLREKDDTASGHSATGGYGCGFTRAHRGPTRTGIPGSADLAVPVLILIVFGARKLLRPNRFTVYGAGA